MIKAFYYLLTYILRGSGIYWFDEEKGYERELKYCSNQRTPFVDEMKGDQRLEHIVFRSGILHVPKNKVTFSFGTNKLPVLKIICSNL